MIISLPISRLRSAAAVGAILTAFFFSVVSAAAHGGGVAVPIFVPGTAPALLTKTGNYERIRNIAIVSGIGSVLTLRNNHLLLPVSWQTDISDWKIDDEVTTTLRQYLSPRFVVEDVAYDHATLNRMANGVWDYSAPALRKFLSGLPRGDLDAFIVVRPDLEESLPGIAGLALENGNGIGDPLPVIWSNYEIDVVDAHTFEIVARVFSRIQPRAGTSASMAALEGGPDLKLEDHAVPGGRVRDELQAGFSRLVSLSLLETLRALNMDIALPPVGSRTVVPIPSGKDPFATVKSVAIISAVGDTLQFKSRRGIVMALSHDDAQLAIADWHLDRDIETLARAALAKRFAIKDVPVDRTALSGDMLVDSNHKLKSGLPGLGPGADVDAYVIFLKHPIRVDILSTDGVGIGLWNTKAIAGEATAVYANYAVAVVDAHTLKLIAAHVGTMSPKSAMPLPYQKVDNALWPLAPPALSPANAQQIHQVADSLLDDSVPETLFRMGLTGMTVSDLPSAGAPASVQ